MRDAIKEDLVIVGAGIAGLTTAYYLRDLNPLVLESESYIGGRMRSISFDDGRWVNLGAQWLPLELQQLATELGVEVSQETLPPPALYFKSRRIIARNPLVWFLKLPFSLRGRMDFVRTAFRLWRTMRKHARGEEVASESVTLSEWLGDVHPDMADLVTMWSTMAGGRDATEISARAGLDVVSAALGQMTYHGAPYNVAVNGTATIAQAVADELGDRVVTNSPVTKIEQDGQGVRITRIKGGREEVVTARECVLAVPAPVALRICIDLAPEKANALSRLPWARNIGVGILMDTANSSPWDRMYWMRVGGPVIVNILNPAYSRRKMKATAGSALSLLMSGRPADELWNLRDGEIIARVHDHFLEIFPEAHGHITTTVMQRWEFAYPTVFPGFEAYKERLAASDRRLHFCGDYLLGVGTDFAMRTGLAAAERARAALSEQQGGGF